MNVMPRIDARQDALTIVDCDIHPATRSSQDLKPFLSKQWAEHLSTYGSHMRQPFAKVTSYPRAMHGGTRVDARPPNGGGPGSDLDFLRAQHLDPNGVEYGILIPPPLSATQRNIQFGTALSAAVNQWQLESWVKPEPRLRASIVVQPEDPVTAVAEIDRRAADRSFVQIQMPPRAAEPLGRARYWPIFEAAEHHDLPISLHVSSRLTYPATGSGWPSFYVEEHHSMVQGMEALTTSLVVEGVFERFPRLKVIMIEAGLAWIPALGWRLDKLWQRLRGEVPHLKRPPSEYIRQNIWYTTQPLEEPERPDDLLDLFDQIGWDRIMLSTDYPHWDFDDPRYAFKVKLTDAQKASVFRNNAKRLYRLA